MSTPSDYFSRKAREARRQARFQKLEGKTLFAGKNKKKPTTQNAGLQAVAMVREVIDGFRLPSQAKLGYTGIRGLRVASNSRDVDGGVVTVHAEFKTRMGVNVGIDIPVEIHNGELLEPSLFIHDGAPRVLAQSSFDSLIERNTMKEEAPIRAMYSPPDTKDMDLLQRKQRPTLDRINTGMFSVRKHSREVLKNAIAGKAVEAGWDKEADPFEMTNPGRPPSQRPTQTPTAPGGPPGGTDDEGQPWLNPQEVMQQVQKNVQNRNQTDRGQAQPSTFDDFRRDTLMNHAPEVQYRGPVTTGLPQLKKHVPQEQLFGPTGPGGQSMTDLTLNPGEQTNNQRPPTQTVTQPGTPDQTQVGMPPHLGPDETQVSKPWPQAASVEASMEERDEAPERRDVDRNDNGDDDWLDPAETLDDHDIHAGMSVSLAEAMEVIERGGIAHDKTKGTKCEILRDHAGDNKSFVVRFEDGLECIVERAHLRTAAKGVKPLFKKKKPAKMCPKCNKAPCICHKKKESDLNADRGLLRQLEAQVKTAAGEDLAQIMQMMEQLQKLIKQHEQNEKAQPPAAPAAPAVPGAPAPSPTPVTDKPPPDNKGGPANPVKPKPPAAPEKGDPRKLKVKPNSPAVPDMSKQQPGAPGAQPPADTMSPAAPAAPPAAEPPKPKPEFNTAPPEQANPEAQEAHGQIMQSLGTHPYYQQKYGPFFKDMQNVLSKPMQEQWKYIPRLQAVMDEMSKDKNSGRLYKQLQGPVAEMIQSMQPKKNFKDKFMDMFRPKEPDLWQTPSQQWTPGGIQTYSPETFKTSRMAQQLMGLGHDQTFVAKVNDELNLMRDAGLSDVDLKQSVLAKYGQDVYDAVFEKTGPQ